MPLLQADLNSMACATPGCTDMSHELFFHSACHISQPVEVKYIKATGVLHIQCKKCGKAVADVQVSGGEVLKLVRM